ncbi:MAG: hypothetical protein ABJB47_10355 [Actinomycetota bacterium]
MNTAAANAAVLVFIIGLAVLLALMLTAVYRTPEWQASTPEGSSGPLPSVPAQAAHSATGGSLFSPPGAAAQPASPAADEASWASVGARSGEASEFSQGGPGGGLGTPARVGQTGFLGEADRPGETAQPTDPGFAPRHDPESLEQATVGRLVVPGSPPWGPAPKPPGVP